MQRVATTILLLALAAAHLPAAELVLLFTNDVHGNLRQRDLLAGRVSGGAAALAAIVDEQRARLGPGDELLLVDSGDLLFGGRAEEPVPGEELGKLLDRAGYAAAAVGDLDLARGPGVLRLRASRTRVPLLCADLRRASGAPLEGLRASVLLELPRLGTRIGVVGILGALPDGPRPPPAGTRVVPPVRAVGREVERLRAQGARWILALSHQGLEGDRELARTGLVDLIVGGSYPSVRVDERVGRTRIVQARAEGFELGRLAIPVPIASGGLDATRGAATWIPWNTRELEEAAPELLLAPLEEAPITSCPEAFDRAQTRAFVLDQMLSVSNLEGHDADLALINEGAVRASLPRGPVGSADAYRIAPFGNQLVCMELPETALASLLAPETSIAFRGRTRALPGHHGRLKVVMNDFLAEGAEQYPGLQAGTRRQVLGTTLPDALLAGLKAAGPSLRPPAP